MDFSALGLSAPLLKAILEQGYDQPYPIQEQAIPPILAGHDILGMAQTGSGKTAAFALPVLQQLSKKPAARNRFIQTLVLVPTRELALQVATVFQALSAHLPRRVKTLAVFGGVSINPQMMALSGTEVLVATPGRLLDLIESKAVQLSEVAVLVLDEADKMLNLGFAEEIERIFALLPQKRQNLLFSATLQDNLQAIKVKLLRYPVVISVAEEAPADQAALIQQVAYRVSPERKGPFLRYLIKQENIPQVLVFVSSVRNADNLVVKLNKNGLEAMALHGEKSQGARTEALRRFKTGQLLRVLVATDLASRGIDIQLLPFVINYDLPRSPKDYVHRIGRTGRAGATGQAITFVTPEDEHHFGVIQKKMGKPVEMRETAAVNLQGV